MSTANMAATNLSTEAGHARKCYRCLVLALLSVLMCSVVVSLTYVHGASRCNADSNSITAKEQPCFDYQENLSPKLALKKKLHIGSALSAPISQSYDVQSKVEANCSEDESIKCRHQSNIPELVFVAGIEGTGHHLIMRLLGSLKTLTGKPLYSVTEYAPEFNLLETGPLSDSRRMGFAIVHKELFRKRLAPFLVKMNQAKQLGGRGMVLGANSFPMGFGLLPTARPDLVVLKYFHCELYKLKIIVTKRHPLPSVITNIKRFGFRFNQIDSSKSGDFLPGTMRVEDYRYIMQARIVEDELVYLNQQVSKLSNTCGLVHIVNFEEMIALDTRVDALLKFGQFLDLDEREMNMLSKVSLEKPSEVKLPPLCTDCLNKTLYQFFEDRKDMWPYLAV